jgi:uncharacterized protein
MTLESSKGEFTPKLVKNVQVPMRDGIHLSCDLIMPEESGRYPGVLLYHPYRKDDLSIANNDALYLFARHGYVGIRLDVRGTGSSEGYNTEEYSPEETRDCIDAINWFAKQDWCTGSLGMFGFSYSGQTSMIAALNAPEPLKAIACAYFSDDRYAADCHYSGGSLAPWIDYAVYGPFMMLRKTLPPYPEYSGEKWEAMWKERLEKSRPWTLSWLEHPLEEDYWHPGSVKYHYDKVRAAVFLIDGWRDGYPGPAIRMYENLKVPKKLLLGPWLHTRPDAGIPGPRIPIYDEMIKWWDRWLKGIKNGVDQEPPITIYVQKYDEPSALRDVTSGFWRYEDQWPISGTKEVTMYLDSEGKLSETAPVKEDERLSYEYKPHVGLMSGLFSATSPHILPMDQRPDEAYSLNFTGAPLEKDVEITGFPRVLIHISSTAPVAAFVARLSDVSPSGGVSLVTKGAMNATRRKSFAQPEPLIPDKIYPLEIELFPTAWIFERGHRVRLSISSSDWPNMWPTPDRSYNSVFMGKTSRSRIMLPTISLGKSRNFPEPKFDVPQPLYNPVDFFVKPDEASVVQDLYRKQLILRTSHPTSLRLRDIGVEIDSIQESEAGVSMENPALAHAKGTERITLRRADHVIEARAENNLASTHDSFNLQVSVEIKLDGFPYYSKAWTRAFKRILS